MLREDALNYHSMGKPGKIEVKPTKPCMTQRDLSLAYTPGVAEPCRLIHKDPSKVSEYTSRSNLVAVVSNGTAVLGLGNIGALAGKPVMEGKGVLFKRFADIDVFDLEINTEDPDEFINAVKLLEPTFGGINLEDIKAPECFYIEEKLKKMMNIPVFHDDQHGTAIISGAALLNACELAGKKLDQIRVVVNGAGAAGIACANHYVALGVKKENIIMCDSRGVIYKGRTSGMNPYKEAFAVDTKKRTLVEAVEGADLFLGCSVANVLSGEMVKSMADNPIIFAMANPDPEITYEDAKKAREDVIIATGRSDYPNQVNNVLGFPAIFRGALDVEASTINKEMKIAATIALASLAKEDVPDEVTQAYGVDDLKFGRDYIIPKPFDQRVLIWEASAVAEAAMKTGVARKKLDLEKYRQDLEERLDQSRWLIRRIIERAKRNPRKIVYPEGENEKILRACHKIVKEGIAHPVLLGREEVIRKKAQELNVSLEKVEIIETSNHPRKELYASELYKLRQRKGMTLHRAKTRIHQSNWFGLMMVKMGDADGIISGISQEYPETIKPVLKIIRAREESGVVAGMIFLILNKKVYAFSDISVNINPSPEKLAEIAILTAEEVKRFGIEPRLAMISFSNFGSNRHPDNLKVQKATEIVKEKAPSLMIDGEMNIDLALKPDVRKENYPFAELEGEANVLIFPDLDAANVAYKLVNNLAGADMLGPILIGLENPVHLLQVGGFDVTDVVNMTAVCVVDAQEMEEKRKNERL